MTGVSVMMSVACDFGDSKRWHFQARRSSRLRQSRGRFSSGRHMYPIGH